MKRFKYNEIKIIVALCLCFVFVTSVFSYGTQPLYGHQSAPTEILNLSETDLDDFHSYNKSNIDYKEYEGILRLHVIANSDSESDQALKLVVRDEVLEMINDGLALQTVKNYEGDVGDIVEQVSLSQEEVKAYVISTLSQIEDVAEEVIKEKGFYYDVEANLERCWIPEKAYGETVFPAGNYEALKISIGKGEGQNWWCVLFPPLCIIDPEGKSLEELQMSEKDGKTALKLKFKTQELLSKK